MPGINHITDAGEEIELDVLEREAIPGAAMKLGVRPLIKHRLFARYDHAHNAQLDSGLYGQRWMAETAFSAVKRRSGCAVESRDWHCQFRELVLGATVYNLEQVIKE